MYNHHNKYVKNIIMQLKILKTNLISLGTLPNIYIYIYIYIY